MLDAGHKLTTSRPAFDWSSRRCSSSPAFLPRRIRRTTRCGRDRRQVALGDGCAFVLLWQTMPDDLLRTAAQQDQLTSKAAIATQVDRMLQDSKARGVVAHFNDLWLHLDQFDSIEKDASVFPMFTADLVPLMAEETHRFLDHLIWDGEGDVSSLFTSPYSFMNAKLASYYGVAAPAGTSFVKVDTSAAGRLGLLTQGGLLSLLAKANQTAPVQRGQFVREQLFCAELPPPPPNIMIKPPDLSPTLSTRERFAAHRSDAAAPPVTSSWIRSGSLENYDGAGGTGHRERKTIDVSGEILYSDVPGVFQAPARSWRRARRSKVASRDRGFATHMAEARRQAMLARWRKSTRSSKTAVTRSAISSSPSPRPMRSCTGRTSPREVPSEAFPTGPPYAPAGCRRHRGGASVSRNHVAVSARGRAVASAAEAIRRFLLARRLDSRKLDAHRNRNQLPALENPRAARNAQAAHRHSRRRRQRVRSRRARRRSHARHGIHAHRHRAVAGTQGSGGPGGFAGVFRRSRSRARSARTRFKSSSSASSREAAETFGLTRPTRAPTCRCRPTAIRRRCISASSPSSGPTRRRYRSFAQSARACSTP